MKLIGREIKRLNNHISRYITNLPTISELDELTGNNGAILHYLVCKEYATQKDIEVAFGITRSTTSTVISLMEKKNLLERIVNPDDARSRIIRVTEKGKEYVDKIKEEILTAENKLLDGFSVKEVDLFFSFIERINLNMKEEK